MLLIAGAIVGVVLIAIAWAFWFPMKPSSVASIDGLGFNEVTVSDTSIDMRGGYFAASAIWYAGYEAEYRDEALYVKIIVSNRERQYQGDPFSVSIPNTYGTIKAVYLEGYQGDTRMIWPKDESKVTRDSAQQPPEEPFLATSTPLNNLDL